MSILLPLAVAGGLALAGAARGAANRSALGAWHAGDGGHGGDTTLGRMTWGRNSGHFGTGTYFVSSPELLGSSRADRPVQDLTPRLVGKTLWTPATEADARRAFEALKSLNNLVVMPPETEEELSEAIERLILRLQDAFPDLRRKVGWRVKLADLVDGVIGEARDRQFRGSDSASTRFLRRIVGADGVDVRGLPDFDNTYMGSVLFREAGSRSKKGTRNASRTAARVVTLPAGTVLYHGTATDFPGLPRASRQAPGWFSPGRDTAQFYATAAWRVQSGKGGAGAGRVVVAEAARPLRILLGRSYNDFDLEQLDEPSLVRATERAGAEGWALGYDADRIVGVALLSNDGLRFVRGQRVQGSAARKGRGGDEGERIWWIAIPQGRRMVPTEGPFTRDEAERFFEAECGPNCTIVKARPKKGSPTPAEADAKRQAENRFKETYQVNTLRSRELVGRDRLIRDAVAHLGQSWLPAVRALPAAERRRRVTAIVDDHPWMRTRAGQIMARWLDDIENRVFHELFKEGKVS